jgi:hypothetical protein
MSLIGTSMISPSASGRSCGGAAGAVAVSALSPARKPGNR